MSETVSPNQFKPGFGSRVCGVEEMCCSIFHMEETGKGRRDSFDYSQLIAYWTPLDDYGELFCDQNKLIKTRVLPLK